MAQDGSIWVCQKDAMLKQMNKSYFDLCDYRHFYCMYLSINTIFKLLSLTLLFLRVQLC